MNSDLAAQISDFELVDGSFLPLEDYFESAFSSENPQKYYNAIFTLFERFPEDDGAGVFWSALHGMEEVGGYEEVLLESVKRRPSEMSRAMLVRMKNSGVRKIGETDLETLIGMCTES